MHRFIRRPSPAMAVAFIALIATLSGTAIALPGRNSVDSGDLRRGSVKTAKIANGAVTNPKVRNRTLTGAKLRNGTLTGNKVRADTLTGANINESTLGQVPSAATANTATTANTAGTATTASSVATLKTIGVTTVIEGNSAVLATHGPFTISGGCSASAANTLAEVLISTTQANSTAGGQDNTVTNLAPGDPPLELSDAIDAPGGTPSAGDSYDDTISAFAPSGSALTGVVSPWADASAGATGECKFHGSIVLDG